MTRKRHSTRTPLWCWAMGVLTAVVVLPGSPLLHAVAAEPANGQDHGQILVSVFRNFDPGPSRRILALDTENGAGSTVADLGICPRVSPSHDMVAFRRGGKDWQGIWVVNSAGESAPIRVLDKGGYPVWSPDGNQLVTSHATPRDKGGYRFETSLVNVGSGISEVLSGIPDSDCVHDWSADGELLLTVSGRHGESNAAAELYVMKPNGDFQRQLTNTGETVRPRFPRFSPNGKQVVYSHRDGQTHSIHIVGLDGNDKQVPIETGDASPTMACWSPDGKHLAVLIMKGGNEEGKDAFEIWVTDLDGAKLKELPVGDVSDVLHPDWT